MKDRAMGLEEVALTTAAMQLAPGGAAGMTIGAESTEPHPALIRTVRIRAEMLRGLHLARPSPRGHDAGWRATGWLGDVLVGLLTGGTRGPAGEARKRLQVTGALGRCRGRPGRCGASGGAVGGPHHVEHETQPHKADEQQLVEKRVWHHSSAPSHRWCNGAILPDFQTTELSAGYRYTTEQLKNLKRALELNQTQRQLDQLRQQE